jgi:hypothetical protein
MICNQTQRKTYEETANRETKQNKTIELDPVGPSSWEPSRSETDKREGGRVDLDQ